MFSHKKAFYSIILLGTFFGSISHLSKHLTGAYLSNTPQQSRYIYKINHSSSKSSTCTI